MTNPIGIAFVFAAASSPVLGEVVTLTPENFDKVVREDGNCLVKFYAPWCGHCKTLAPEYEAASELIEGATLAHIDCDSADNKEICGEFEVRGFPTLKWFPKGSDPIEYDGGRKKAGIVQWVDDIQKPVVREADAMPEAGDRLNVVLEAAEISDDFEAAAKKNRKNAVFSFIKSDGDAKCTIVKKGDEPIVLDALDEKSINSAVDEHRFAYFGELNAETYGEYTQREGKKMFWTLLKFDDGKFKESVEAVRDDMEAIAKEYKDYSITYTDTAQFAQAIEGMLGVTEFPAMVVQDGSKKYVKKMEVTKESVTAFLDGIASGDEEPSIKSEDIPETQPKGVRTVVAKSLKDELFQDDKDVLLKVYAPWCGHCKTMAPEFDAAAEILGELGIADKVSLGKLDGTLNDSTIDGLEWSGFPTLVFAKAGTGEFIEYNGPREKVGMLKWIAANSEQEDVKATADKIEKTIDDWENAALDRELDLEDDADEADDEDKEEL